MTAVQQPAPQVPAPVRARRPAGGSPVPRRRRRRLSERLTLNVGVGLIAGLVTFVLIATVLRDRREMVAVAVASERIPAGVTITESMVHSVQVPAAVGFVSGLVSFERVSAERLVAARTVQSGEVLPASAVGQPEVSSGARVMSIPVESWQAAGGEVQVGDQVDVIDTGKDGPSYVLTGAAVVGRSESNTGGGLGSVGRPGGLFITVEVNEVQALALAATIESGKLMIVRSTGATPVTTLPPAPATTVSEAVATSTAGG